MYCTVLCISVTSTEGLQCVQAHILYVFGVVVVAPSTQPLNGELVVTGVAVHPAVISMGTFGQTVVCDLLMGEAQIGSARAHIITVGHGTTPPFCV